MSTAEKLAPGTRRLRFEGDRSVIVRRANLRRARIFQEMIREAGDDSESQMNASLLVARWGVVDCEGLFDEDGRSVVFERVEVDGYGMIASEDVVEALYPDELARIVGVIAGDNAVSQAEAGN